MVWWGLFSQLVALFSLAHRQGSSPGDEKKRGRVLFQTAHQPVFVSSCHEDLGSRAQPSQQTQPGPPAFTVPRGFQDWTTSIPSC